MDGPQPLLDFFFNSKFSIKRFPDWNSDLDLSTGNFFFQNQHFQKSEYSLFCQLSGLFFKICCGSRDFLGKWSKELIRISIHPFIEIVLKVGKKLNIHSVKSLLLKKKFMYKVQLGITSVFSLQLTYVPFKAKFWFCNTNQTSFCTFV